MPSLWRGGGGGNNTAGVFYLTFEVYEPLQRWPSCMQLEDGGVVHSLHLLEPVGISYHVSYADVVMVYRYLGQIGSNATSSPSVSVHLEDICYLTEHTCLTLLDWPTQKQLLGHLWVKIMMVCSVTKFFRRRGKHHSLVHYSRQFLISIQCMKHAGWSAWMSWQKSWWVVACDRTVTPHLRVFRALRMFTYKGKVNSLSQYGGEYLRWNFLGPLFSVLILPPVA